MSAGQGRGGLPPIPASAGSSSGAPHTPPSGGGARPQAGAYTFEEIMVAMGAQMGDRIADALTVSQTIMREEFLHHRQREQANANERARQQEIERRQRE